MYRGLGLFVFTNGIFILSYGIEQIDVLILSLYTVFLSDDLFMRMKERFLKTGRGWRPSLLDNFDGKRCPNKILLQLRRLMLLGART